MPADLKVDATGDLDLTGGRLNLETDQDELDRLELERYLDLFRGEWFLDQGQGLPWLEVLSQKYDAIVARSVIATGAAERGFVLIDPGLTFNSSTRVLTIEPRFRRADGTEITVGPVELS